MPYMPLARNEPTASSLHVTTTVSATATIAFPLLQSRAFSRFACSAATAVLGDCRAVHHRHSPRMHDHCWRRLDLPGQQVDILVDLQLQ